ncbi:DEAD/DEAH box helicase domain protein [uncultured delta proteobacterium]|uniref:DEAD/DEAH box helicase domain protein n=1 Tax=uncultured delta proteobacterium TaxID=34034 RepID=A0A212JPK2_9DELT|nr:DEAD/DEAH box helicase domain protein [uncultured delta proteobacterium]
MNDNDLTPETAPAANHPSPPAPLTMETLPPALRDAVTRAGWDGLMEVQAKALPYLLAGRDIMVQSRTGSGKTGAFLLPALERLDRSQASCQCLVLVPTRELALQVAHEAEVLFGETGMRSVAVYGGVGYGRQMEGLKKGAHLVVGTPGRVLDHLLRRTLNLDALRMLVFDEADRMLSIGFYPDMKAVQRYLPKKRIPTHFFSATYPPHVLRVAGEFMETEELLSLSRKEVHIASIEHAFYAVKPMEKDRVLVRVLELENPAAAIIFCNTKANVHYVTALLQGFGYNADELSADLNQTKREDVLTRLRKGEVRFLVATDVAARGIDIPDLSHVILYEPPEDHESYIHRAGRTARAGADGTVISLVDIMQKMELARIAKQYSITLTERTTPSEADLAAIVGDRLTALLEAKFRAGTSLERERVERFLPLARSLAEDAETLPLLAMLLDDIYQANRHPVLPGSPLDKAAKRQAERRAPAREASSEKGEKGGNGDDGGESGNRRKRRRPRRKGGASDAPGGGGGGDA